VGMSATEVEILEVHVQVGDRVQVGDPVVDAGADKVDFTIEAEVAGTVAEVLADAGDVLEVGSVLVRLEDHS